MPNPIEAITARHAAAITPSDSATFDPAYDALYVGVAGNISLIAADDSVAVTIAAVAGSVIPLAVKKVNSTSTTATGIIGLRY